MHLLSIASLANHKRIPAHPDCDAFRIPEDEPIPNGTRNDLADPQQAPVAHENALYDHPIQPHATDAALHRGRVSIASDAETDYEHIFDIPGLSRWNARPRLVDIRPQVSAHECIRVCYEWYEQCISRPHQESLLPTGLFHRPYFFDPSLLNVLPARLSFNNYWVRFLLPSVFQNLGAQSREVVEYEASIGDGWAVKKHYPDGDEYYVVPFLGIARPGHLVWKPRFGFRHEGSPAQLHKLYLIRGKLLVAEQAMVRLARRVARWVCRNIVCKYLVPESYRQRRSVLSRDQINRAVKEILGQQWFDLPYDREGSLRTWSMDDVYEPDLGFEIYNDGRFALHRLPVPARTDIQNGTDVGAGNSQQTNDSSGAGNTASVDEDLIDLSSESDPSESGGVDVAATSSRQANSTSGAGYPESVDEDSIVLGSESNPSEFEGVDIVATSSRQVSNACADEDTQGLEEDLSERGGAGPDGSGAMDLEQKVEISETGVSSESGDHIRADGVVVHEDQGSIADRAVSEEGSETDREVRVEDDHQ